MCVCVIKYTNTTGHGAGAPYLGRTGHRREERSGEALEDGRAHVHGWRLGRSGRRRRRGAWVTASGKLGRGLRGARYLGIWRLAGGGTVVGMGMAGSVLVGGSGVMGMGIVTGMGMGGGGIVGGAHVG